MADYRSINGFEFQKFVSEISYDYLDDFADSIAAQVFKNFDFAQAVESGGIIEAPGTIFEETFETYTGAGFDAAPTPGQLDSNLWRVTGLSTGAGTFGGTHDTGDFARGTDADGGVGTGGMYAFTVGGNTIFGFQPGGSDVTPGEITFAYTNNTGATITDLTVIYDIWANNDQARANSVNFAWSLDDVSYTSVIGLNYTSDATADALGFQLAVDDATANLTGLNLAAGATVYLQWQTNDVSGGGSRDELGIDDLRLEADTGPDVEAPILSSSRPTDDGSLTDVAGDITLTFNESVQFGTGDVTIYNAADDTVFEAFDVATSGAVSIIGGTVTINPSSDLILGNDYYIQIDATAIEDLSGNAFAGINDTTSLNFDVTELRIGDIQGTEDQSVMSGETVTISAIVTGDHQTGSGEDGDLEGFFVQDAGDGNAMTSDGIFIYDGDIAVLDVSKGDRVSVTGVVTELFGKTVIDISGAGGSVSITNAGEVADITTLVQTIDMTTISSLSGNSDYRADLEAYESMLVDFQQTLTVIDTGDLGSFGEFLVSAGGRPEQFTQQANNGDINAANYLAYQQSTNSQMFLIDDGFNGTDNPVIWPDGDVSTADSFRLGNTISDAFGVLDFGFSNFRLRAIDTDGDTELFDEFTIDTSVNARPGSVGVDGELKVASVNVENYFTTLGSRGADTPAELARQTDKVVAGLLAIDADVFGLVEVENDFNFDGTSALETLVNAMNAELGSTVYAYVDPGQSTVGSDAISTAFIYKTGTVEVTAGTSVATLTDADLAGLGITDFGDRGAIFDGSNTNRVPIAVSFTEIATGHSFTATANHFKSKGGSGSGANADQNDGVADWNEVRTLGAQAIDAWLASDPTGSGDADFLILGDLNSYAAEDPIDYLVSNGFVDLNVTLGDDDYSYVFDALVGTLDYALANNSLAAQAVGFQHWNGNSDELELIEYMQDLIDSFPGAFDGDTPWRFSDHDAAVVSLNLGLQTGTPGVDTLTGTANVDTLVGLDDDDTLIGGGNNDILIGGAGADVLDGGAGFDSADYSSATSRIQTNVGNDFGSQGDATGDTYVSIERIIGSDFNDIIVGGGGVRQILGGLGNDVIRSGAGDEDLRGDEGNDTIYGGEGADTNRGGSGTDTVWYRYSDAVTIDLEDGLLNTGDAAGDTFSLIERFIGSDFDDSISGRDGLQDRLFGGDGNDTLIGRGGNDYLDGGAGGDVLDGGAGIDYVTYFSASSGVTIDLSNAANNTGDAAGDSYVDIERFYGSNFDDAMIGGSGNDFLRGLDGVDTISGGDGSDRLLGEDGNDILDGGGDIDRLFGGQGDDTMTGGAGNDGFYFAAGAGADTITDFDDSGNDRMIFQSSSGVTQFSDLTITQEGLDVLVSYAGGTITLLDTDLMNVAVDDFAFI